MGHEHEEMNVSGDTATCSDGCKPLFRKPYVLTKQREAWSAEEHQEFLKAIQLYNRDWKKVEAHIGTKTVVQIRSHAQKWFQKTLKSGNGESVPPPRPKRKTSEVAYPDGGASADSKLLSKSPSDGTYVQGSVLGADRSERKTSVGNKLKSRGKDDAGNSPDVGISGRSGTGSAQQSSQQKRTQKQQKASQKQQKQDAMGQMEPPNLCLVYSYLGSLFDSKLEACDFSLALLNMRACDRLLSVELMEGLSQRLVSRFSPRDGNDPGTSIMKPGPIIEKLATNSQPRQQLQQTQQQASRRGKRQSRGNDGGASPQRVGKAQGQVKEEDPVFKPAEALDGQARKALNGGQKKERVAGMMSSSLDSVGVDMASMGLDKEMEREFALFDAGMNSPMPDCQGDILQEGSRPWDCGPDVRFDTGMGGINIGDLGQLYCTSKDENTAMPSTLQQSFSGCSRSCGSDCSIGSSSEEGGLQERSGTSNDLTKVTSGGVETGTG